MNLTYLNTLIESDIDKTISTLENYCLVKSIKDAIDQYLPSEHKVNDATERPDKQLTETKDVDGKPTEVNAGTVKVARLALPLQKKIVLVSAAFLGIPVTTASPENEKETNLFDLVKKVLTDNKVDYNFKKIAKYTMSETECAELWYAQSTKPTYWDGTPMRAGTKIKFRSKILARSLGYKMYPVFDAYGDMIAFGNEYESKGYNHEGNEETTRHFDLYTADRIYYYEKKGTDAWSVNHDNYNPDTKYKGDTKKGIPNDYKKIPIIYFKQPATEWADVQPLIERLETKISNHADTNDYFDSPILTASGDDISAVNAKTEQGKMFLLKNGSKLDYLTWDQAPESMKMEIENLLKFIHSFTHTPDISFENMKGLGVFSGIAIKMLFLDAHLKASDKEEIFGEAVQRRINYIKNAIVVLDASFKSALTLDIKPVFNYFLPENDEEKINLLVSAVQAGILSKKTAVSLNPYVDNADNEMVLIGEDAKAATNKIEPVK